MNPAYGRATFTIAAQKLSHLPPDEGAEVAFAGRSNAGKSSAINTITGVRSLARTSKTPGRTQQILFFDLDERRRLVDLPGYGYAKVPEAVKREWYTLIEGYLSRRQALKGVILVMDTRHPLTPFDTQMLEWCNHAHMPVHVLLTKSDKLSRGAASAVLHRVRQEIAGRYGEVEVQLFSAPKRIGIDLAHEKLDHWLGFSQEQKESPEV